ncbi:MAG: BrnT family toxin, partial [bacterium]
ERFVILGMSYTLKIIVVCHCYKSKNEVIRIISARKAMKKEEKTYMELL